MQDFKLPPHSVEAEQSVLGGLLINSAAWDEVADILSEEDFYRNEHKLIYRHITRLISRNDPVDILTVAESINSTGKLDTIGGLQYLGSLESGTPSAANIKHYAKIVKDKATERKILSASFEIGELAFSGDSAQQKLEKISDLLNGLADNSKSPILRLSEAAAKAIQTLDDRFSNGGDIHGLKTGFIDFDHKTGGLHPGDLIILAGRPSMGKTAFATNIAENVALDGNPAMMFSLEMSDEQLATRSISSTGMIKLNTLRSAKMEDDDWHRITASLGKINEMPLFIDSNPMLSATQMHARARRIKRQHGLSLIVIDYLQLMSEGGDNRNNELSNITRKLKLMAKDLHVPVICLSQLSRKVEERADKRPMMSDLRDSGAIEQDADLIVMMYREEYYNKETMNKGMAEANIVKQRMGEVGPVFLTFQGEYSKFSNFAGQYHRPEPKRISRGFDDGKSRAGGN